MNTLHNRDRQKKSFRARLYTLLWIMIFLAIALLSRLIFLQWTDYQYYHHLSRQNYLNFVAKAPKRGLIMDRHHHVLADNQSMLSLEIKPKFITQTSSIIERLHTILPHIKTPKHLPRHRLTSLPIQVKLTEQEAATFYVHRHLFPECDIHGRLYRSYPYGHLTESALGKTGRIQPKDLMHLNKINYLASLFIGRQGLEAFYEPTLHGLSGLTHVAVNAHGQSVTKHLSHPPKAGQSLIISLDLNLQKKAYKAFAKEQGALVAIDPNNGEILALLSVPNADPNQLITNIDPTYYHTLIKDNKQPLFNRALSGLYPPGSTIKPLLALAALDQGLITTQTTIEDPGYYQIPHTQHHFRDWTLKGHGTVNVTKAIIQSCDTFFYWLSHQLGIATIDQTLAQFGLGSAPKADLIPMKSGVLNSPAWKKIHHHQIWYPGDTLISGIGQGNMLVTPLQMANAVSQIAMRGHGFHPHLLLNTIDGTGHTTPYAPEPYPIIEYQSATWKSVIQAMSQVTTHGTGWRFGLAPYTIAGKTGTVQLFHSEHYHESELPRKLWDHAWFIGFAPVDHPKIAIAVLTEHSHQAIAIARQVLDAYLLRSKA